MSHDGATAGHDAAVTRSVYGHPAYIRDAANASDQETLPTAHRHD
jgi:hypothetical protein